MLLTVGLAMSSLVRAEPIPERLPDGFPTRRGRFAFASAQVLANPAEHEEELEYLSQFDVVLTNGLGIAPESTRDYLQAQGCKLFLYFWTNGIYAEDRIPNPPTGEWCDSLVAKPRISFVGGVPLPSLAGRPAYYYDLTNGALVDRMCVEMAKARAETGYDGVFFDYAGVYALPPEVAEVWQREHPREPYDPCVKALLRRLREVDPECLIFTNQAYRSGEALLGEVHYDLAESLATSFTWGPETDIGGETIAETYFRPWPGEFGVEGSYGEPEAAARRTPPRRDMLYLDYMQPRYSVQANGAPEGSLDLEAVYYSYCAAALFGRSSFCSGWYSGHEYRGPLYSANLGRPVGEAPAVLDGIAFREYERGLVALLTGPEAAEADLPLTSGSATVLHDLLSGERVPVAEGAVRLTLEPPRSALSGTTRPVGRVYLKVPW